MLTREEIKNATIECNIGHTIEDLYEDAFEDGQKYQKELDIQKAYNWFMKHHNDWNLNAYDGCANFYKEFLKEMGSAL